MGYNSDVLILSWSHTGNTRAVAEAIDNTVRSYGLSVDFREITRDVQLDFLDYRLVFCGAPVYSYLPPDEVAEFLRNNAHSPQPSAPELPGRGAVMFCTYGGGHTGIREATPALKYMGQFFEHTGIRVVDEWAAVGEFKGAPSGYNTAGRLGDITGRPDASDLKDISGRTAGLLYRLQNVLDLKLLEKTS